MTKIFLLISLLIFDFNQDASLNDVGDYRTALTGNGTKAWYLYARTPDDTEATCKTTHAISLDNTYTFYSDGTFEFDHGTITEEAGCENDCCSDLVNMVGKWKFTNSKQGLKISVKHEKGNASNALDLVLYDATIIQLDDNVLKLTQANPETNILYSFEFRKK